MQTQPQPHERRSPPNACSEPCVCGGKSFESLFTSFTSLPYTEFNNTLPLEPENKGYSGRSSGLERRARTLKPTRISGIPKEQFCAAETRLQDTRRKPSTTTPPSHRILRLALLNSHIPSFPTSRAAAQAGKPSGNCQLTPTSQRIRETTPLHALPGRSPAAIT